MKPPQNDRGLLGLQKRDVSCQLHPIEKNKDMALFDLQIISFWASKNASELAEIMTSGIVNQSISIRS